MIHPDFNNHGKPLQFPIYPGARHYLYVTATFLGWVRDACEINQRDTPYWRIAAWTWGHRSQSTFGLGFFCKAVGMVINAGCFPDKQASNSGNRA